MAEKKSRPTETPPDATSSGRSGENLNVWVQKRVMTALRKYLAAAKPRVTKTATVEEALEAFLTEKGFPLEGE